MKQAKFFLFLMLSFCCIQVTQLTAQNLDLSVEQTTAFNAANKVHQSDVMTIQKDETLTNEEKRLKIDASKSKYEAPPVRPVTKTVELTLKGIFMSPCNEGVAGYVEVELRDKTTGYTIRSREGTRSIYKNPRYSLSCPVYDPGGYADGLPSHVLRGDGAESPRPETQGSNLQQSLSYTVDASKWKNKQYEFKIRFTLGSQHRDNFMAVLGNHWLATGQNRIEEILPCDFLHTTIGPYVTPTNRQHEYWLQFSTNAY